MEGIMAPARQFHMLVTLSVRPSAENGWLGSDRQVVDCLCDVSTILNPCFRADSEIAVSPHLQVGRLYRVIYLWHHKFVDPTYTRKVGGMELNLIARRDLLSLDIADPTFPIKAL